MASTSQPPALPRIDASRLQFLKSVAPAALVPAVDRIRGGTLSDDALDPSAKLPSHEILKLRLGNSVADLSDQHAGITRGLLADPDILTLRDIGSQYDNKKLAALLGVNGHEAKTLNSTSVSSTALTSFPPAVLAFQRRVFHREPSAVVARMVRDDEIPVGSTARIPTMAAVADAKPNQENSVKDGVVAFFQNNPDFNLRKTSVLAAISAPETMRGIPDHVKPDVVASIKLLQTTQALSHTPEALPGLAKTGMTTAHAVAQMPEAQFVASFAAQLGGESVARDIHVHATNVVIRNDLALTSLLQTVRGSGVAMIGGGESRLQRVQKAKEIAANQPEQIDLERLFGPLDVCACDDCNSVTSAAAYFVEILQYLRNNNLDINKPASGQAGYAGTPLEVLLRRRPDLADLELTCANTNTVLPYIDLANEVMESFIVNMQKYASSSPKQATLDVFNADPNKEGLGGSGPELLAQPQNTNDKAYCILKEAVYPSTKLPFHQPVEAIRLYLDFIHTNRADLGLMFRKPYTPPSSIVPDPLSSQTSHKDPSSSCSSSDDGSSKGVGDCSDSDSPDGEASTPTPISPECRARLSELHDLALSRADDAERLLVTEEEYIILTKEAFWTKEYFDTRHGATTAPDVYRQRIGVKPDHEYWGVDYTSLADMLDQDEVKSTGLTFVKLQFMPRTGLAYAELVDLLKTDFINPNMPKGRDKVILESFRSTFKFMKALVDPAPPGSHHGHKYDRFKRLVDFLHNQNWRNLLAKLKLPDTASLFEQDDDCEAERCHDGSGCECCRPAPRCRHHYPEPCQCHLRHGISRWLCKNFDRIGKIIVLESVLQNAEENRFLGFEADLIQTNGGAVVGHLKSDGKIFKTAEDGSEQIGTVKIDGAVTAVGDNPGTEAAWSTKYGLTTIVANQQKIGTVNENSSVVLDQERIGEDGSPIVVWSEQMGQLVDDCDIRKDRLRHLDGTSLCAEEYDRMHRFVRLWRKLGWSMVELDVALRVLGMPAATTPPTVPPEQPVPPTEPAPTTGGSDDVDWNDFVDDCQDGKCGKRTCKRCKDRHSNETTPKDSTTHGQRHSRRHRHHHRRRSCSTSTCRTGSSKHGCKPKTPAPDITPDFLHELVSLKKLADLTGLPLLNLLAFWGPISTSGSPSLYSQLFLTHNLLGIDQVFKADANDNYLAASPAVKMSDHVHIMLAAFGLQMAGYAALTKMIWPEAGQDLTIETVSSMYRYVLLGRVLGVKPETLNIVFNTLGVKPFSSAATALELVELWNKISDSGFSFPQLRYVFTGTEDPLQPPVGPSQRTVLQAAMTLYTGLNDIDAQHPDITSEDAATSAAVLSNVQLLFTPDVAAQIVGFLDGTLIFQTKAPSGLIITIPKEETTLAAKLKYADAENPALQVTGQLTQDEAAKAKLLSASPQWAAAIDRVARRAATFLKGTLSGVFPPEAEAAAKAALIVGDVVSAPSDPNAESLATAPKKRLFFLSYFMSFLRRKLADKLVVDTVAAAASLDSLIVLDLLTYVITVNDSSSGGTTTVTALPALEKIKVDPAPTDGFTGYLIPETTDAYTLVVQSESAPPDIMLDSNAVALGDHSPDDEPPDLWASQPLRLTGGRLYAIELKGGVLPKNLMWKADRTQLTPVPSSALLGNHVTAAIQDVFLLLYKCAVVINGFSLTSDEVMYFQTHAADFGDPKAPTGSAARRFDWNKPSLAEWKRLADYTSLKNSLPKLGRALIDLFKWMNGPDAASADTKALAAELAMFTLWSEDDVARLIDAQHFDIASASNFRNEISLLKLQKALDARIKIGVDIDLLFLWAQPRIDFWKMRDIRDSIRVAIRAQFKLSDWEVAIKPTHDKLRQLQSDALTAYLINQPALKEQRVVEMVDADSLFEFLLIDNQMCPCMETARLKQATSAVQLFVQRCMLGLEPDVPVDVLDRGRWDWMQKYRVWEANRKVYLYPENWIQPSLRDDKSPIYLQLESELNQRDLDTASVLDAMKDFLFRLDDIANLEVDAIYVASKDENTSPGKVHIFARTRAAPYKFFYRAYDGIMKTWQPWQDMAVDVPRHDVEKPKKTAGPAGGPETPGPSMAKPGGFYLVPFTFNSRLLVAIPQFQKTQLPAPVPRRKMADLGNNADADESTPDEFWEIKMGLTELRNGRWTPKQVTSESIAEAPQGTAPFYPALPPLGAYKFIARKDESAREVHIDAYRLVFPPTTTDPSADADVKAVGRFTFTGSQFGVDINGPLDVGGATMKWSDFHFQGTKAGDPAPNPADYRVMYPIQGTQSGGFEHEMDAYIKYPFEDTIRASSISYGGKPKEEAFYHPFVDDLIDTVSRTDNLDDLFSYFALGSMGDGKKDDAYGSPQNPSSSTPPFDELYRPYSLYNWELGFHAPMATVDRLLQNQQFDLALKMIHYIFDPLAKGSDEKRYWKWPPFHDINSVSSIEHLFDDLRPNTPEPADGPINAWRNNPFQPHVVARLRPTAYMKFVVMKYISILIAYGDYYFLQNTLETIPMAIQCYVLASHIYGKPTQKIPKRGDKEVQTYRTLLDKWDAFSNAMVQMEVLFPFSINQIPAAVGVTNGVVGLANIFGFAATQYFCLPDNPDLKAVRDTIDDRLFKVRHCQDIKGVERKLPLYEPPIDPGLLVAATAAGLTLSSILNDLNSPLPNFRFKKLVKKALEMCEHLKDLGTSLVVAKERKDGEALMALKQRHESTVHGLVMNQKKLALAEANKAVDALHQTRKAPEYRMKHNLQLLGEDLGSIPTLGDVETEFKELADKIEAPVVESGMKLIAAEKDELEKAAQALNLKPIINAIETAASELHVLPILNAHASPFGVGIASCWGPPNIAKGIQGVAKAYQTVSDFLAHQSAKISRVQTLARTTQARVKEANSTGHEIKKIDKQIVTHQVRVAVQEADVAAHEKAISNTEEVQDFLTSKYTSTELYTWVDQETSNLYYRTYTAAYDLAKKAEMAFRYERGLPEASNPPPFVRVGYWEPKHSGLLCGERLMLDLKDLEAAYYETRGHDYEITKHVSLRAVNPLQLLRLRGDALAEFAVPEILFDMDFPGHYGRRLKSVALTIRSRADVSPYDNVNCTLRLTAHKFRNTGVVKGKSDYPEKTDADDDRFSSASHVPIEAIATSSPSRDSGVFELDFSDGDRFLPFEGAGAVSAWRLELNEAFRGFDYDAIDDVVLSLQYTSLEGGARLRDAANGTVADYVKSVADLSETEGLYVVFDVPRDFSAEWAAATAPTTDGTQPAARKMSLTGLNTRLPAYAKGHAPERIQSRDVWIVTDKTLVPGDVSVRQGGTTMGFSRADGQAGTGDGAMSALHSTDGPVALKDWMVGVGEAITEVKEMWILIRYSLRP